MFFKRKINYVPNIDRNLTNTKNPNLATYKSTEHGQMGWLVKQFEKRII